MKKLSKILLLSLFLISFEVRAQDLTPPTISVEGAPPAWQNTDATATVSCLDSESGCDSATERLWTTSTAVIFCPNSYGVYSLISPQTISERE